MTYFCVIGADIIPAFFFGNTSLFDVLGSGMDSWLAKVSRKLRTSIMFFYGRLFLPVPYRHPIHMVTGKLFHIIQCCPSIVSLHELISSYVHFSFRLLVQSCVCSSSTVFSLTFMIGKVISCKQKDYPTDEEIDECMNQVIQSVEDAYKSKCPEWEKRPLKIL
jgi:hypothetical protein